MERERGTGSRNEAVSFPTKLTAITQDSDLFVLCGTFHLAVRAQTQRSLRSEATPTPSTSIFDVCV